ncbi:MAG: 3',5'-cyclic adenosine monophosphate phosphodiesterase CpdA [Chloroflexi bacterium ADurb.Bin325]|nr:MAG: 3',5'-cyclic adenosine monophosphate phosphodiesterase CpdA [Chloroflexi bacterium ADurb.Bin325]
MAFSFVQITDHHLQESESATVRGFATWVSYRAVLRHIAQHVAGHIDFIVSMGDLVDPAPDPAYRAVLAALHADPAGATAPGPLRVTAEGLEDMPMYFVPGNHDDLSAMLRVLFPGSPDMERMNVRFEHRGVRFVCLDWGRDPSAQATPELFEFLAESLADDRPAVILTHHAVAPVGAAWLDQFLARDVDRFWNIVRGRNVLGVLAGHVHMSTEELVAGVPVYTLRSTGFQFARQDQPATLLQPPHYRLITIHDGVLTSRLYEVSI